jgi:hypothetical protein
VLVVGVFSIALNCYLYFSPTSSCDHFLATASLTEQLVNAGVFLVSAYVTDFAVMPLLLYIFWEKKLNEPRLTMDSVETEVFEDLKVRGLASSRLELSPTSSSRRLVAWPMYEPTNA